MFAVTVTVASDGLVLQLVLNVNTLSTESAITYTVLDFPAALLLVVSVDNTPVSVIVCSWSTSKSNAIVALYVIFV